ncbi:contractile injection system protein, VgrG/Pvc8 family, partial [Klebsiella pneumoniae]
MRNRLINDATSLVKQPLGQSRYRIDVHGCTEFLDVLNFRSVESLSQPWRFDIAVTSSTPDIASEAVLLKPASFTFQTPIFNGAPAVPVRTVYGVVASFERISMSNDDTRYAMTIVPRIALLDYTKGNEIYLNQ